MIGSIVGDIIGGVHTYDIVSVELPNNSATASDFAPLAAGGASIQLPTNSSTVVDYAPGVQVIFTIDLPTDSATATDYAANAAGGALIDLPNDPVTSIDHVPEVRVLVEIDLPNDSVTVTEYAPLAAGSAVVDLPNDAITASDYAAGITIIIDKIPRFYLTRSGSTVTLTFLNRDSLEIEIERASQSNSSFSVLDYTTSDTYSDSVPDATKDYKYKIRFVDRPGGTVTATSRKSITKFTRA